MTLAPGPQATAVDECAPDAAGGPGTPATECCSLSGGPMGPDDAQRVAALLKALSDPTRLRLLSHVAAQGCEAVCACDLTEELGISQPTVSHHMKKLVDAGLLTREQRGKWAHYSVVPSAFAELRSFLELG
ncbi:ArsR/SmtB family transcription factor [Kocuria sp. M1N1S27]|uniref:ArsR/SmtB family transcription factor n=1 Tax=Kocuria kalidii TaxID=3376283 RepID=UPI003791964C